MKKIQKVSRWMIVIFNVVLIMVPFKIVFVSYFSNRALSEWLVSHYLQSISIQVPSGSPAVNLLDLHWNWLTQSLALLSGMIYYLPTIIGIFFLKTIFKAYQAGNIFSELNAIYYRRIGMLLILDGLLIKTISRMLMTLAVTLHNAPGHRTIEITFNMINLEQIFWGIIVMVISWVMLEGTRLREETLLTV